MIFFTTLEFGRHKIRISHFFVIFFSVFSSIAPGRFNGKDVTVVDVFEGVGKYTSKK